MRRAVVPCLLLALLLATGLIVFSVGCGESEEEKAEKAYEEDVADLKAAVEELKNPETFDSLDSLKAAFENVKTAFDDAVASGRDVADAKITQLEDAFNQLRDDIDSIPSDQSYAEKLDDVNDAVQKFADEVEQL